MLTFGAKVVTKNILRLTKLDWIESMTKIYFYNNCFSIMLAASSPFG